MPGIQVSTPSSIGPSTALFGDPASFTSAANKQLSDYDKIMAQYRDLTSSFAQNPITSPNVTPQIAPYEQSSDVTKSLSNLSDLATTGGYSDSDIADIRARDIAPTRSIYASAQQGLNRQKQLQGGYSPNYTAASAKLAREESNDISNQSIAANAGIAQNVAANKLAAAAPYASASSSASAAKTAADRANADIVNQINEANANRTLQAEGEQRSSLTAPISGQASLYGTTPALTNTFGNEVIQVGQLGQGQQQINEQKRRDIFALGGN